jgi:hypothetical protein
MAGGIFRRIDVVKVETESLYGAQDIFSRVSLQSCQLRELQNQDWALKNVGRRRWKDMERRWQEKTLLRRILVSQVSQAPGEDCPE